MIALFTLTLLIIICFYVILIISNKEGFFSLPRLSNHPAWANLSDDQVFDLMGLIYGSMVISVLVDPNQDPAAAHKLREIGSLMPNQEKPFNNQDDINGLKNTIRNKASEDKNVSVAYDVIDSHDPDIKRLARIYFTAAKNNDQNAMAAMGDNTKDLIRSIIKQILKKMPRFPFNPELRKLFPETLGQSNTIGTCRN